ncbi:MAG TPA: hypothetical protein VGS19_08890 [Streptosporangiaceae bacterium]|nr:hypothetical protein [Streptosporangiaceae bacterium]
MGQRDTCAVTIPAVCPAGASRAVVAELTPGSQADAAFETAHDGYIIQI